MKRVIIMRGLPGSGKSTYLKTRLPEAMVVSADAYFEGVGGEYHFKEEDLPKAHQSCLRKYLGHIRNEMPLIAVENVNAALWEMSPYVALADAYGYHTLILHAQTPVNVCLSRQTHNVPESRVLDMQAAFEKVLPEWKEEIVIP